MKRKFLTVITICLTIAMLSSCWWSKQASAPAETPVPSETPVPTTAPSDFYNEYKSAANRPIAVMIDNDNSDAWPHAGLSAAYLVYEITVEGSATRLMALFPNSSDVAKIGPVRSSRHYFLDYALEHDAIYAHFGWSPNAQNDIPALGVNNINGLYDGAFWRERKNANDYHSAFTSIENLKSMADSKGYRTERKKTPLNLNPTIEVPSGESANSVSFAFAPFYSVKFEYNNEQGTYARLMNGAPHALQENAEIAAENIIVMKMSEAPLGDGSARINISDVGTGEGYFISCGKYVPITWSKQSRDAKTVYKDKSGKEIALNPGQTWIEIVSPSMAVTIG